MTTARQPHALLDPESRRLKAAKIVALLETRVRLPGLRAIDVGCGAGFLSALLAEKVGPDGSVDAVDTRDLRQTAAGYDFTLVHDTSLPFGSMAFDAAVSNHVIEHVGDSDDQLRHLQEIQRVLRPGGVCYLALPNSRFPFERHFKLPFLSWLPRRLRSRYVRLMRRGESYDCDIPSPRTVRDFAARAGFSVAELTFDAVAHYREVERPNGALALLLRAPSSILRAAMWLAPSKMYLLTKPTVSEDQRGDSAGRPRVHLVGPAPTSRGGIAQFNAELARVLDSGGAIATLWAYRRIYPPFSRAGRQALDASRRRHDIEFRACLVPWFPWTWWRTATAIRRESTDVVVIQWWHPITALCCRVIARRARAAGIRVVYACHNALPHEPFPLARPLTRLALAESTSLIALSEDVGDQLRKLLPGRQVSVVPLPSFHILEPDATTLVQRAESWRKRLRVSGPGKIVLFFGNVRPYKGLGDLIEAFPEVRAHVEATLVVVGNFFAPIAEFRRRVEDLGIASCVHLIDEYVPNEDVAGLFAVADLVVLPYRSASQSGVVTLAAMLDKPVVATAVGGLAEALAETGVVVPPNDRGALATGIIAALRHPPEPPRLPTSLWPRWREAVLGNAAHAGEERRRTC